MSCLHVLTLAQIKQAHRHALMAVYNFTETAVILGVEPSTLWRERNRDVLPPLVPVTDAELALISSQMTYAQMEAAYVVMVMECVGPGEAARMLGIERSTLLVRRQQCRLPTRSRVVAQ